MCVCVYIRAVKVNALIYEIIVAEINSIKYFNAVNATLFTSGAFQALIVSVTCWQLLGYFQFYIGGGHGQCAHLCVYVCVCVSGWNSAVRDTESRGEIPTRTM